MGRMTRLIAILCCFAAAAACSRPDTAARRDTTPSADTVMPRNDEVLWFRQARALNLTDDGIVDSAIVEARGTRSDSLQLRVAFLVDGQVGFSQDWSSEYQLALADSVSRRPPGSDAYMRASLARVLESIRISPLDTSFVRDFPGDTAALRIARRGPVPSVSVSYGYETVIVVVWDAEARQFLVAHACC